ncbi:hypothetical protein HYH03_018583 [Edaphochlamys debaryana]|uniref:Uncharacterized protein n=1 Tax=Edaphochlamys debaryana TaxID=47281 RepID=A0A835XEZ4_9CHLO|nr:hypothetical protein HYH03_018583 [Edaphochlamys debaryana]|eukprot:KAG2482476.1 hypothetical protein HYH03_018583 [Edaphochlamys debaryana]
MLQSALHRTGLGPPASCRSAARSHACRVPATQAHPRPVLAPRSSVVARARAGAVAEVDLFGGEDFYTILGLSPAAEASDIRRAYRTMMREFHPDLAPAGLREDMQRLCVLLNEIYETLNDEEKRAVYDTLAGFSSSAVNPFLDASFPRDQVFVDEISCIGCGKCVRACMKTFEIEESKYGRARVISQTAEPVEEIQIAIESCPVDCIHWVSLPQLSLLEAALASMARIEVSVMQRFGRSGGNVFAIAAKAWERRMAAIEARAAAAAGRTETVDWSFWTDGSSLQYDEEAERRKATMDPEQRRIANLAASAARASRMWRLYRRACASISLLSSDSSAGSMDVA